MALKASDIVNDSNVQVVVDYVNSMMDKNSVSIYRQDGKTYLVLDNGSGIEITDKTTVSDVMYTFSNYYSEDVDLNEVLGEISDKKTQNQIQIIKVYQLVELIAIIPLILMQIYIRKY